MIQLETALNEEVIFSFFFQSTTKYVVNHKVDSTIYKVVNAQSTPAGRNLYTNLE